MVQLLEESIVDSSPNVHWDDVQGLREVKKTLFETIIYPSKRPDIFTGLRAPTRGILFYGPPGNGKTMIAKAVATECKSTFFNISAATLMSKWLGEGEKLMRTLFALANERSPSVVFFDEIDSLLGKRGGNEHEASRRMKTEFLVQVDGVAADNSSVTILAATNRPFDLDEAALRRMPKRILIPLPDEEARRALIEYNLKKVKNEASEVEITEVIAETEGYSCADLSSLVREAAMMPVREIAAEKLMEADANTIRGLQKRDFTEARKVVRPSVSKKTIVEFEKWQEDNSAV